MKSSIQLRDLFRRLTAAWNKPPTVPTLAPRANLINKGNMAKKEVENATVQAASAHRSPTARGGGGGGWSKYLQATMGGSSTTSTSEPEGYEMDILDILEREIDYSHVPTSRAEFERNLVDTTKVELATEGPGSLPRGFRNVRRPREVNFGGRACAPGLSRKA